MKQNKKRKGVITGKSSKSRSAAFFDVDGTLVKLTTDLKIFNHLFKIGEFPLFSLVKAYYFVMLHKLNLLKIEQTLEFMGFLNGRPESELIGISKEIFTKVIKPRIKNDMVAEVKAQQKEGRLTVLLSNFPEIIIKGFKDYLKMDYSLGTVLEVKNKKFTGKVTRFCYSGVKRKVMEEFARTHNIDLKKSFFYTDSYSDLPTLLAVGTKVIVNPDPVLKHYAKKKGWRIIYPK